MIRNTFAAVLTVLLVAGSATGETIGPNQIKATYKGTHGSWVHILSTAKGAQHTAVGPYDFVLSTDNSSPTTNVKVLLDRQAADASLNLHPEGRTMAYCFDLYQVINGSQYTFDLAVGEELKTLSLPAPVGQVYDIDDKKLNMLAYIWAKAYKEGAYDHQLLAAQNSSALIASHALSLAIWETVYEYETLPLSNQMPVFDVMRRHQEDSIWKGFKVESWDYGTFGYNNSANIAQLANDWLRLAYSAPRAQDVSWLLALYSNGVQDQSLILFEPSFKPVPEPTLAIQLLGLCVAGALPLRYWRRGRKGAA